MAKKKAAIKLTQDTSDTGGGRGGTVMTAGGNRKGIHWLKRGTGYSAKDPGRVASWDVNKKGARAVNKATGEILKGETLRGFVNAGGRVSSVGYDG